MGLILLLKSNREREFVAACQRRETHKMHFKGMNVMKNELNCNDKRRDMKIAHVRQRTRKESETECHWNVSWVVKFPVHQCTFVCDSFHSSYVRLLTCVWKYLRCFCCSPSQFMFMFEFLLPLLVESRCAYFHCDSIQSSRFAWYHPTFRNFLDGNRIPLEEMKIPRMFDINSSANRITHLIRWKICWIIKVNHRRTVVSLLRFFLEPLIAFSALEMHISSKG